jgi:hypothetical protein
MVSGTQGKNIDRFGMILGYTNAMYKLNQGLYYSETKSYELLVL